MKYLLGIDFGGGASKATLLCENGKICAVSTTEYPTYYPQPGYVEQDPRDWVRSTCENIRSVMEQSGIAPADIACIALDAATHTAVVMDEGYNIIRPSIYWTDTRSTQEVNFLKEQYGDLIQKQAMHAPGTIWTLPELLWIKNNEPDNWKRVKKILFAKDYVRHILTGDYVTDHIEAEGSMLFDVNTMQWSKALCDILEIDTEILPKIVKPTDIVGAVTADAAALTGLATGTPIICGTTDTAMEVFASGAVKKGQMTLKLATAGRICVVTDSAHPDINLVNYSHIEEGLFYPGTATKSCAASYRWFRDVFGGEYESLNDDAEKIPIGSDGLIFHPYLNGELTPYANPNLCADFLGIRSSHTKAHFTRAVLEGVTMSMLDCKQTLDRMQIPHEEQAAIIGGGAQSPLWRQMVSDALNITLVQMEHSDSSLGSAMLAGIAAGLFQNAEQAIKKCNRVLSVTRPIPENTEKYKKLFARYKACQKALEPIYNDWAQVGER